MATTKYKIAEQVRVRISGGDPSVGSGVDIRDIIELVGQVINGRLKAEYYNVGLASGEVNVGGMMLATYEGIDVVQRGKVSHAVLPVMPIKLFKNQGVFEVSPEKDDGSELLGDLQFIPVPAGMWSMRNGFSILSDFMGQVGYVNEGMKILFTRNIVTDDDVKKVRMKLVVADVGGLGENDLLPVPADMEIDIFKEVLALMSDKVPADKVIDSSTEPTVNGVTG